VARQLLDNCPYQKIPLFGEMGFASRVFHFPRFRRIFVKNGIPIFTASQILDLNPKADKFVSKRTKANLNELALKEGQIVITCSGTIGFSSIVSKILKDKVFSHDLIRIECTNPDEIGYVYAFLKTEIGRNILSTNNYGSVVTHIEPEHLSTVNVPNLPVEIKKEVHEGVMEAYRLRDEANDLLNKAETTLYQKLGLSPIEDLKIKYLTNVEEIRAFSIKIGDWHHRLDGSYHIPIINEIMDLFKKLNIKLTTLGDKDVSEKIILPGRFKRVYVDEEYGVPFLSGGDILQFDPEQVKYLSVKHHNKRIGEQLTIHENMILVSCSGTIGNIVLVPAHFDGWTANQHILRIVPSNKVNAGYIYAFLSSSYGEELIKRQVYGSVVDEIDDNQLATIVIPLPTRDIQDEIGNLALEAKRKWTDAYRMEKDAIKRVEEVIISSSLTKKPV
jgi:type I restriction enzyme S subunit